MRVGCLVFGEFSTVLIFRDFSRRGWTIKCESFFTVYLFLCANKNQMKTMKWRINNWNIFVFRSAEKCQHINCTLFDLKLDSHELFKIEFSVKTQRNWMMYSVIRGGKFRTALKNVEYFLHSLCKWLSEQVWRGETEFSHFHIIKLNVIRHKCIMIFCSRSFDFPLLCLTRVVPNGKVTTIAVMNRSYHYFIS